MNGMIDIVRVICDICLYFKKMANILALLRDLGKSLVAWDLFIKLDNIYIKIVMLDLRIVVGI